MRTTLDLPDPLFRELKARSALRGMLLKDYVAEILQTGLAQTAAAEKRFELWSRVPGFPSNRWTDAWIAALASSAGARVISFDSDFTTFPDLDFLHLRP